MISPKVLRPDSKIATSQHYGAIIREYNKQKAENGKVVTRNFFNEVVKPLIPDVSLVAFYKFLSNFKKKEYTKLQKGETDIEGLREQENLLSNHDAESIGISRALNMGAKFYDDLMFKYKETPDKLTNWEKKIIGECLFRAMKARDSRLTALGKLKEGDREEDLMERAFNNSAY